MRHVIVFKRNIKCMVCSLMLLLFGMAVLVAPGSAHAQISQVPLFMAQQVKPNIMLTMDNSGSMAWGSLTGYDGKAEYDNSQATRAYYSSDYNQIYYNPDITYTPAVDYKGVSLGNSNPASASSDAFPTLGATKYTVNLTATCWAKNPPGLPLYNVSSFAANTNCQSSSTSTYNKQVARYAHYYTWDKSTNIKTATPSDAAFPTRTDIISTTATYTRSSSSKRTDCVADTTGATCSYAEEIQNFANWFSYYRTRIQMAKTAMGAAFAGIDQVENPEKTPKFRVGFNTINGIDSSGNASYNNTAVADGNGWLTIRDFDATQKQKFFARLHAVNPSQGTPLRTQMDRIGKLFRKPSQGLTNFDYTNNDPYRLSATDATLVSCRASFHVMTTDGYWNDSFSSSTIGNQDGVDSGYSTRARGALDVKNASNTLADIALYYYKTDLRDDIANSVKPATDAFNNPTNHQHVVTYTIGLGANGTLTYKNNYDTSATGDFADIKANKLNWPAPVGDENTTTDDLWHAAVNGGGTYFSAKNPEEFKNSLIQTLKLIDGSTATASAVAFSENIIQGGAYLFQPTFQPANWTGNILAYKYDASGNLIASYVGVDNVTRPYFWDAASRLPAWGARNIATWNGTKGVDFAWPATPTADTITASQKTALVSQDVLSYLRGDGSKEVNAGGIYRNRETKLGDIVNSAPYYSPDPGKLNQGYGTTEYSTFIAGKTTRTPLVYVGANDGMLHAFDAATGVEKFAYIPASVYPNLINLTKTTYDHQYFVDGKLNEGDAYLSGAWKTILVGTTGAGAKSVFAIDITDPSALGAGKIMWEKGASGDDDLGNLLAKAEVVQMANGQWAAVFGNGYYSNNMNAVLYIVNLADGTLIKKIDTHTLFASAAGTVAVPNGLSAPVLEVNKDRQVITAYAGDLKGNLWKFDLSDASPTNWKVAYSGTPLFTTNTVKNGSGQAQPIIQKPALGYHPQGGFVVNFGTGKYFDAADDETTQLQSVYGIWDKPPSPLKTSVAQIAKSQLVTQTLHADYTVDKLVHDWGAADRGWYVDLTVTGARAIGNPSVTDSTLSVTILKPIESLCSAGGESYILDINYLTGNSLGPVFDTNGDGLINGSDSSAVMIAIPGTTADVKIIPKVVDSSTLASCGGYGQEACRDPLCGTSGHMLCALKSDGTPSVCGTTGNSACNCGVTGFLQCPPPEGVSSCTIPIPGEDSGLTSLKIKCPSGSAFRTWRELSSSY